MTDPLVEAVRTREAILFVGAGVSVSLGLPSWSELISEMAVQLNYDPLIFEGYGNFLELAEYYELTKTTLDFMRSWMNRKWHTDEDRVDKSRIHQAIIDLRCPMIYTTNFDRWLEISFARLGKSYTKIANVGDFTKIKDGSTQIVKFHGDLEDDGPLVLTETSYFERLSFESPLDIKLRSDCIGRTILFVGYRLSDINIRYLLFKLQRLWDNSAFAASRPKSFIFLTKPNPVQEAILDQRKIIPIVSKNDDPTAGLAEFLEGLAREAFGTIS
jgi:hypothetical protein